MVTGHPMLFSSGSPTSVLRSEDLRQGLIQALDKLGPRSRVLLIPPDATRSASRAGELTRYAWEYYGKAVAAVLPALGTHFPMSAEEIREMFGPIPLELFAIHDWKRDLVTLGEVPASYVREVSEGTVDYAWPAQVNRLLVEGGFDLILSIGQVVPHEVIGMANYTKNILVGTGGAEGINKSHFLGAAYGMERIMGRADTPVRRVLDYAADHFAKHLPIVYVQTVIGPSPEGNVVRGLYISDSRECFLAASALSQQVNITLLEKPISKAVVYLNPSEFKSTWLGNKSIYRTRMALADGGQLIVLAPGIQHFGEDKEIDRLIRAHGYCGTPSILQLVADREEMRNSLSAAAHLIHGSSEGRFEIVYCPGQLSREEVNKAGFSFASVRDMMRKYDPQKLRDGFCQTPDGEEIFFVSNPALGLWAHRNRFEASIPQ